MNIGQLPVLGMAAAIVLKRNNIFASKYFRINVRSLSPPRRRLPHRPKNQSDRNRLPPPVRHSKARLRPFGRPRHLRRRLLARRHAEAHCAQTQMPTALHHRTRRPRAPGFCLPPPKSRRHRRRRPAPSHLPGGVRRQVRLRSPARHAQKPRQSPPGAPRLSCNL